MNFGWRGDACMSSRRAANSWDAAEGSHHSLEDHALQTEIVGQLGEVDVDDGSPRSSAAQSRRDVSVDDGLRRVDLERADLRPVDHQIRPHDHVDAHDIGPADLKIVSLAEGLDLGAGFRRRWRRASVVVGIEDRQWYAEDVDVLRPEQISLDAIRADDGLRVVADTAQAAGKNVFMASGLAQYVAAISWCNSCVIVPRKLHKMRKIHRT